MNGQNETIESQPPRKGLFRRNKGEADGAASELPKAKSLGPLRMVYAAAAKYPRQILLAFVALLVTAAATLAIPWRFKVIIDEAFGGTAGSAQIAEAFQYLLMMCSYWASARR